MRFIHKMQVAHTKLLQLYILSYACRDNIENQNSRNFYFKMIQYFKIPASQFGFTVHLMPSTLEFLFTSEGDLHVANSSPKCESPYKPPSKSPHKPQRAPRRHIARASSRRQDAAILPRRHLSKLAHAIVFSACL